MASLDELKQALGDEHAEHRREAAMGLAEHAGDRAAGALLLVALGDPDWRVREEAVSVGQSLAGAWGLIPNLVDAVSQGANIGLRNAALELLGTLGDAAVSALVGALGKVDEGARKFLIEALAHTGATGAVTTLVAELDGAGPNEVASVIDALGAIGGPDAERALREQLRSTDVYARMAAMDALNRVSAVVPWSELSPLLQDRLVFRVALEALGRCAHADAIAPLLGALADRSPRVAGTAAVALTQLTDDPELGRAVAGSLEELDEARRARLAELATKHESAAGRAAVELLCVACDSRALPPALELAASRTFGRGIAAAVRSWGWDAVRLLLELHGEARTPHGGPALEVAADLAHALPPADAGAPLIDGLRGKLRDELNGVEPDMLAAAARCMSHWAEAQDARRLVALASSEHADVQEAAQAALEGLAERDRGAVAQALVGVNPDRAGGAQLAGLIVKVTDEEVPAALHAALLASDPATRCAAIRGLASHAGGKTAELLALSLTDESADVQVAAADALGKVLSRVGSPEAASALAAALSADTPAVQAAAARALAAADWQAAGPTVARLAREGAAAARVAAVQALPSLAPAAARATLESAVGDAEPEVVKQALKGLRAEGFEAAAGPLRQALAHVAWDVRSVAAALIGELLRERQDAGLQRALQAQLDEESDAYVREALLKALGREPD